MLPLIAFLIVPLCNSKGRNLRTFTLQVGESVMGKLTKARRENIEKGRRKVFQKGNQPDASWRVTYSNWVRGTYEVE